jgi:serine/threonine protein kinase/GTPase SAR1 family protein
MGNRSMAMKSGRGVSMSTVGVDIGDWTYEKKTRNQHSFGPVIFRTWDFGGQQEYYTTHQYFLSRRSLYLVLWKIADGEKGINEIQQWLINIQARAANSPVLIVGTHQDVATAQFPPSFSDYLQNKIRERFINLVDPEKCGLPRVIDSLEVSCKTKYNIRHLANLIYDTAFSLRSQGSKQRLLEQKIPATYLHLEEIIGDLCVELRHTSRDPVLGQEEFEHFVTGHMKSKHNSSFRDSAELHQATSFLHENGVMLHYDDATLKDLYFLDPQWLCDMLSHVVTIREINPFVKNGIMQLDDLKHVFKSSAAVSLSAKSYIVNLLNKFEVGLTWDSRTLLIPSLLPTETMLFSGIPGIDSRVTIPLRSRGWSQRGRRPTNNSAGTVVGNSSFFAQGPSEQKNTPAPPRSKSVPARRLLGSKDISSPMNATKTVEKKLPRDYELSHRSEPDHAIHRLILLAYLPSGFWSRLLTRLLGDDSVVEIIRSYFIIPQEVEQDPQLGKIISENKPEWVCWQTGLELQYLDTTLFSVREVLPRSRTSFDYHHMNMMVKQEGKWTKVEQTGSAILEISLPQDTVVIKRPVKDGGRNEAIGYQALVLDPCPKMVCQFLSMAVEHIDQLLEDWYPSLGTRFVHTSEGKMLVTRLVPCPRCLVVQAEKVQNDPWKDFNFIRSKEGQDLIEYKGLKAAKMSQDSSDRDSGNGYESPKFSKGTSDSMERKLEIAQHGFNPQEDKVYTFLVEECILFAFDGKNADCPLHAELSLAQMAPDTVFLDLGDRLVMSPNAIKRGSLIGRGAFGFVFGATCRGRGGQGFREVAIKMLQPVDPGLRARSSSQAAYKAAMTKWERDPMQYACKAYCTARQELNILLHIKHPHVVPLVGICIKPLAIVLDLAPLGALDSMLKHYRRSGDKLSVTTIQQILVQIARALEYLHQQHIIYRDLKSENVLVWSIPQPFEESCATGVQVKLADYGISRACLPTGTKGFGGTEGFMAPEIMKYNGEEEYTEKVDCFSFGMFLYELLTLHQPFEGQETVKEVILEGGRPPLTQRELSYPTYFIDLMVACWSHHSRERPSASQIVSITSAPEFTHLLDVILLDHKSCFASSVTTTMKLGCHEGHQELWLASNLFDRTANETQLNILDAGTAGWQNHFIHKESLGDAVTSMTTVQDAIWIGTSKGEIHAYSTSSYKKIFCYSMDPESEVPSPIRSLYFIKSSGRVVVALHNGRIFLCQSNLIPISPVGGEGTFILTELGTSDCVHCVASLQLSESQVEIWCGQSEGAIAIFSLTDSVVTNQDIMHHTLEQSEVMQVVSTEDNMHIFSYLYPGCVIYQWEVESKSILSKLDCSKLIPCSESLVTINIDDQFSPGRCQVSTLSVVGDLLYIGTCWGCLVVVETSSLRPVTVFRPYSEDIQSLVCFTPTASKRCMVSIGRGYRDLIKRYCSHAVMGDENEEEERAGKIFALLWRTDSWVME